jgi:hypothetical protein
VSISRTQSRLRVSPVSARLAGRLRSRASRSSIPRTRANRAMARRKPSPARTPPAPHRASVRRVNSSKSADIGLGARAIPRERRARIGRFTDDDPTQPPLRTMPLCTFPDTSNGILTAVAKTTVDGICRSSSSLSLTARPAPPQSTLSNPRSPRSSSRCPKTQNGNRFP